MSHCYKTTEDLAIEAKKYASEEEFIESQNDFRDAHAAPCFDDRSFSEKLENGGDYSLAEVIKGHHNQPSDYFDPKVGARYYNYQDTEGMQSWVAINNVKRGVKTITAYRAIPKDVDQDRLIDRDWISFSEEYAVGHGELRFGEGEYRIIKQEVDPREVWWDGNDIREWGYDTGKTKKLSRSELITIWEQANK